MKQYSEYQDNTILAFFSPKAYFHFFAPPVNPGD